jgi:Tfp pilus assembly protein PilX
MIQRGHKFTARHSQRGVTLVVGMIMLVLITLVVLASFQLGRNNLEIVGNAQRRNDALTAARGRGQLAVADELARVDLSYAVLRMA